MLRFLRIRNLAVIEAVDVEFEPGFNVLTGETGAGKSIVVEAVALLLGGRASSDLVRTGESQASIEAIFETADGRELIVRREMTSQGRSRSFIDGALATAGALRALAQQLVELHGQHEHQALLDPETHLPALDTYASVEALAEETALAWSKLRELRAQLDRSRMDAREKAARLDLLAFHLSEIDKAAPQPGEDEALTAQRQVLASAERVQTLCADGYAALYERDDAILAELAGVWKRVGELAEIDPQFAIHLDARDGIRSQLEDLAQFLRRYGDAVDASPERLQQVEDRLVLLDRLKRKHGGTLQDVITAGEAMRRERDLLSGEGEAAADLEQRLVKASAEYLAVAHRLSAKRRAAGPVFARAIEALLGELAMAGARFEVRFDAELTAEQWTERGIDRAEFFLSANPGEDLRPLARIVSGGELSRVMLAMKTLAASSGSPAHANSVKAAEQPAPRNAPADGKTLIFDEVDAGIGGRVADVVGAKLQDLGRRFQVLCITHLPHIAARATTQFRIEKSVRRDRTVTSVTRLDDSGRVDEIARMIGGSSITGNVRASAEELLAKGSAPSSSGKQKTKHLRRG
jgi:DNA repair protein RecN (Recombination protein N)